MRCPRCHLETGDPAPPFCARCGAPLRLADEPPAPPLDVPLALDRRGDRADPAGPKPTPPPAAPRPRAATPTPRAAAGVSLRAEPAPAERSGWQLGAPLGAPPRSVGPAPTPRGGAAPLPAFGSAEPAARAAAPEGPSAPPTRVEPVREPAAAPAGPTWAEPLPAARAAPGPAAREPVATAAAAKAARAPAPADLDVELPDPEVDALEIRVRRPETWRRVAAGAIDVGPFVAGGVALLVSLLRGAGLAEAAAGIDGLLDVAARERAIVLPLAAAVAVAVGVYATLAHALAGATLGKRLLGLAVVGPDGRRPSLGRSAARALLSLVSAALLGLGLLLALFTRSGRALHDFAARTWVVDARRGPARGP